MDWDFYYNPAKKRVKKKNYRTRYTTKQRTIKDYTNNTRNPRQRATSAGHDKP
jgi:hypothetical protein